MFEILDRKGNITIRLTSGDSAVLTTVPFIDDNENNQFDINTNDTPIILGDDDYVLFTVASPSGRIYIKKIITKSDYNSDNVLTVKLYPEDTISLQPFSYLFSFAYMPNKGEDCYTYATGAFEVLEAISTVKDLDINSQNSYIPTESGDTNDN